MSIRAVSILRGDWATLEALEICRKLSHPHIGDGTGEYICDDCNMLSEELRRIAAEMYQAFIEEETKRLKSYGVCPILLSVLSIGEQLVVGTKQGYVLSMALRVIELK